MLRDAAAPDDEQRVGLSIIEGILPMGLEYMFGALLTVALTAYLLYALLKPEQF
jgi:K+-transporting ATPase KdpF subunit